MYSFKTPAEAVAVTAAVWSGAYGGVVLPTLALEPAPEAEAVAAEGMEEVEGVEGMEGMEDMSIRKKEERKV
jgi:hypothetical protein